MQTFSDLRGEQRPAADLPLFDAPATVRTFDTPEFRDITFYEVEAKSILNHVPAASRLGFEWTIKVRVGDAVYGTTFDGKYRRYVTTQVLAHWSTVKPAYRVTLEDGTELVASGDHRFLTNRGWKHVTGEEHGPFQRPHLGINSDLVGPGRLASPPQEGLDYQRGYLCGIIRGDGHIGSYRYQRPGRTHGDVHRFRLALSDIEALQRARTCLRRLGVITDKFVFSEAATGRKQLTAIRNQTRRGVAAVTEIIAWPDVPSVEWHKGFLAGIFDAEGSHNHHGGLRIANTDRDIIDQITTGLQRFGFSFSTSIRPQGNKPLTIVRLIGGLPERLRFYHTFDPAISRKRTIEGVAVRGGKRRVVSIEPTGIDIPMFDVTTGTGDFIANGVISHNCFARPTHTYLNMGAGEDFERKIVVKVNAPEVLRRELRKRSWKGAHVAMGTNTDPYQRCEGRYRLTRGVLEALRDYANPCSILTKSPLLLRDLDLFTELASTAGFTANLSIGTLDEEVWRRTEPGTPHPRARMQAVEKLNRAGVPTGVLVAPILPGISDSPDQLKEVVRAAADAGASHVSPITLHLRPGVKEEFMPWLEREYPELVERYRRLYRGSNAPKATQRAIAERVSAAKRRFHPSEPAPEPPTPRRLVPPSEAPVEQGDQLSLLD